jgi:hypothetical protein
MNQAQAFLKQYGESKFGEYAKAFQGLPKVVQAEVQSIQYHKNRAELDKYFVPENRGEPRETELSPSGKYRLVVTPYGTKPGCWTYTQGLVYEGDTVLFEVRRNYSSFPFEWIEDHPNGHSYLVNGEDYQGQTVLELDTGRLLNLTPVGEFLGWGFCWASYQFNRTSQILIVNGCYWACPYEFRFYDFSDPMNGWPELKPPNPIYDDNKSPTIEPDGTIKCYQSSDDNEEGVDKVVATTTFRRDGQNMVIVEEWVDEEEQKRRVAQKEANRKYEEWLANYKTTDPIYLVVEELAGDPELKPESFIGIGRTYEGWCPDFKGSETRITWRIHKDDVITAELDWGVETAPVKLQLYKDGKKLSTTFFEHSVEGVRKAFAVVKEALR